MKKLPLKTGSVIMLLFAATLVFAQDNKGQNQTSAFPSTPKPKRFISAIEVFAGSSLCFNYGNKFVENYEDENVTNKRLLKVGYTIGIGAYHPISDRIDLNVRLQYEQKGSNNELNVPLNPVNGAERLIIETEYTYSYLTIALAPKMFIGKEKKWTISLGGYYSFFRETKGYEVTRYFDVVNVTIADHFNGRKIRGFRDDGGVNSIAFSPGLKSFEKYDYGVSIGFGHLIRINHKGSIMIQIADNLGLSNINKPMIGTLDNPSEKNHTVSLLIGYILERSEKK